MKSLFNFIAEPKQNRTTSKKYIDGKELILNTDLQNHLYVSRLGVVKSVPLAYKTKIQVGDEIIVHHNVFRRFYDIRSNEKNSRNFLSENEFLIQPDQIFAYKRNGKWNAISGFCFVKPIKEKSMFSMDKEKPGVGIVKYSDGTIEEGSLVGFKEGLEYEFFIEEERLYRIPSNLILLKYEYKGDEEEYNPSWTKSS